MTKFAIRAPCFQISFDNLREQRGAKFYLSLSLLTDFSASLSVRGNSVCFGYVHGVSWTSEFPLCSSANEKPATEDILSL